MLCLERLQSAAVHSSETYSEILAVPPQVVNRSDTFFGRLPTWHSLYEAYSSFQPVPVD